MREYRQDPRNRPRRPFRRTRLAAPRFFQLMGDMPGPFALELGHRFARRMINKHLRIVRQLHANRARPAAPVHVFGDGYPCKRADPREIALPEGEVSGAGKMLLSDVQLLAIADRKSTRLNSSH